MGKQINSPFDDVSQDVDDFDSEWLNVDDDPERFADSDYDYDKYYSDNVEDSDSDETDKLLKDKNRRAKEYERLRSEYKELQKDIKKYDEQINKLVEKGYEAQAKNDEEHLESLRSGVDDLRQTLKERKDRLNEVAKKLDYFEGKNSKSNDRWGVDPQPQLQIDDSTPAEHIVDIIEPKNSLDDVDLSKLKGRRNRRNKGSSESGEIFKRKEAINTLRTNLQIINDLIKGDSSTQQPSIEDGGDSSTQQPSIEELEENIKYLEGGIDSFSKDLESLREQKNTDYGSTFEGGIYKLLEKGDIGEALNRYHTLREDADLGNSDSVLRNISKIYGITLNGVLAPEDFEEQIKRKHEGGFVPDFSYIFDNYNNVDDEIQKYERGIEKLKKEVEEKKKLLEELKQAQKLKEESDELDEEIENVAEELSNDPVYNKEGEFDGHTATTTRNDTDKYGELGDIDGLTWDDVIYNPIKKEYINRHTGQVVKGRPPHEEDPEKVAEERNERLKDKKGVYSSILETIGSFDDSKPLGINSDGKFTTLAYMEIAKELDEEIREKYGQIEQASNSGFDDIADGLREQLFGIFNLVEELQKLQYRELDAPGTLRAVKDAYEQADYKSEVGEGAGQAVHHLEGYNWKVGDRIDPNNLILLSNEIHDEFHKLFGTGNNTIEQFIEFLKEYHPEELPKFMEKYGDKYEPKNINDKLYDERENWDENTYRKQYNRWNKLPWLKDFDENVDKALFENMAYSGFFLSDVEVPIEKEYKRGDNFFKSARLSPSDSRILDIYEGFVKNDWKRFDDMNEFQLANVLNSRLTVEALNGVIDEKDVIDIDTLKGWSRDELLEELYESQNRGKKVLEDTISGKRELPFLGEDFGGIGEDNPFANSGLGKGLIPVIEGLKDFFAEYGEIVDIGNPFEDWDSSNLTSDKNIEILSHLFNTEDLSDGFSARTILNHVLASLPGANGEHKDKLTEIGDPSHQRDRIREFNEAYYDDSNDEKLKAWRDAKNNLAYLLGIGMNGASTETINEFFSPQGRRKPLSDENVRKAFGFNPQLSTYTGNIDADLADMAEALGYIVKIDGQGGLTFARNLRDRETDPRDWINYLPNDAVVMVDSSKSETRTSVDEANEKAIRSVIGKTEEPIKRTSKSDCCNALLDILSEINGKINNVGESIAKALRGHVYAFGGGATETKYVDKHGNVTKTVVTPSNLFGADSNLPFTGSDSGKSSHNPNKKYRNYRWRVDELNDLLDSTNNEEIKAFAEDALGVAKNMHSRGIWKYERNFDVVHALLGGRDISKLSQEEIEEIYSKRGDLDERIRNTITQSQLDKQLSEKDDSIKALKSSSDLDKKEKIAKLEKEKEKLLKKEIIGDDEYQYLQLKLQAYNKLREILSEDFKLEAYEGQLSKLISAVSGVKGFKGKENGLRVGIRQMEEMLNLLGIDTSEAIENSVAQVGKTIRYYENKLKKTNDVDESIELEGKIKNLKDLRKELKGKGEPDARSRYGHSNPNIPHPSEESLDEETWKLRPKAIDTDEELVKIREEIENLKVLRDAVKSEYTKSLLTEQIDDKTLEYNERREKLLRQPPNPSPSNVFPSDMYDHIEHTTEGSSLDYRWDYLREQFNQLRVELTVLQKDAIFNPEGIEDMREEYDNVLEKLTKIREALYRLAEEDGFTHNEGLEALEEEFGKIGISIDKVIEKEKELDSYLDELAKKNQVGLDALFGDKKAQKQVFGDDWVDETYSKAKSQEKAPLEGRLTRMAYNFRQASQSANQFSGVLTKLFSIVGTGNALNDMITASSLRQTNQIMLASSRGMEEAKKLYDRIQMLVVKLPGNDTFLTNILTMLGTMDKSLSAEDLEYMGGVIADYYMGAQAKGQFNNETERELRNYLMTGQTRNLTNSIIASEIESLKGLNSVKERTVALEKALQATGMDSIAHYDSYTNSLEEFKGRFQKAFADLGDLYLGFLQGGMKVYNFIDSLTNSALSQFVITIAVSVMGLLAFFGVMAELLSMSAGLIEAFDTMNKLIIENDKQYSGMAQTFRKVITWIAYKTGVVNADTASQVINTDATIRGTLVEGLYVRVLKEGIYARLKSIATTVRDTVVEYAHAYATYKEADAMGRLILVTMEGNKYRRIGTLFKYASIVATKASTLNNWLETGSVIENTKAYLANTGARISNYLTKKLNMNMPEDIEERNKLGMDALFGDEEAQEVLFSKRRDGEGFFSSIIRVGIPKLKNGVKSVAERSIGLLKNVGGAIARFLATPLGEVVAIVGIIITLVVLAVRYVGQLFGWWSSFGEMFQAIGDGIHRVWDAFMNSEPIQYIITTFQNLSYTLGTLFNWITSIGGNIWQTIFGVDDGSKSQVFDIVGVFLEVIGAIGKIAFTPLKIILDIINAIGSAIAWFLDTWNQFVDSAEFQGIIKDFQEIRAVIGEAWNTLSEAFNEVRDAFMSVFEDDEDMKNAVETTNILLDVLRAVATFLRVTIIPIIKFIAYVIKGIADVIKFVVDIGVGVIDFFTGGSLTQDSSNLVNQSQLAQNYTHQISNAQTIINNNFASGSVLTDARNMTAKEVMKLFTSAFGFNKARGVDGVIN